MKTVRFLILTVLVLVSSISVAQDRTTSAVDQIVALYKLATPACKANPTMECPDLLAQIVALRAIICGEKEGLCQKQPEHTRVVVQAPKGPGNDELAKLVTDLDTKVDGLAKDAGERHTVLLDKFTAITLQLEELKKKPRAEFCAGYRDLLAQAKASGVDVNGTDFKTIVDACKGFATLALSENVIDGLKEDGGSVSVDGIEIFYNAPTQYSGGSSFLKKLAIVAGCTGGGVAVFGGLGGWVRPSKDNIQTGDFKASGMGYGALFGGGLGLLVGAVWAATSN